MSTTIVSHQVLSGLSMPMGNSMSSTPRAMATSSLCRHHLVSILFGHFIVPEADFLGRGSRRSTQLDKEAQVIAYCLYGYVHCDDGISLGRCLLGRQAHIYLYRHLHHDNQQRHRCHVPLIRMVDSLLASSCVAIRKAPNLPDFCSCIGCSHGGCTNVSFFWNISGNQNPPGNLPSSLAEENMLY